MSLFDGAKMEKMETNRRKKDTILIVDDEIYNLQTLSSLLSEHYTVLQAKDGQLALDLITQLDNPEVIKIIISDQRMPRLTGVEFLSKTISIIPHCKRIILTGFTDVDIIIKAINDSKLYKFILKPYDQSDFLLTIQRALESYELEANHKKLIKKLRNFNAELEKKVKERTFELEKQRKALLIMHKKEKESKEKLAQLALYDPLTGLGNRRLLQDRLNHAILLCERNHSISVVMYLDIDNFKSINDQYGHACGDKVLIAISQKLKSCIRSTDLLSRLGGDEFILLQQNIENSEGAIALANKILESFRIRFYIDKEAFKLSTSIGIRIFDNAKEDLHTILRQADEAMYKAKQSGKGNYHLYGH